VCIAAAVAGGTAPRDEFVSDDALPDHVDLRRTGATRAVEDLELDDPVVAG
jgi:hypothetical protein